MPRTKTCPIIEQTVKGYNDDRIVYFKLAENKGISENTNRAFEKCTGTI